MPVRRSPIPSLPFLIAASILACQGDAVIAPTLGTLEITTSTSGADPDPDGYTVSVDGGAAQPLGTNATLTLAGLAPGSHSVALAGVASNCQAEPHSPRAVGVTPGSTATITFGITCGAITSIAFTSGLETIFLVNSDGTGLTRLTEGRGPSWAPDRRKILFLRSGVGLYVINADGSDQVNLFNYPPVVESYNWSPDGRRIAFTTTTCVDPSCHDFFPSLRVMQADGSGQRLLADSASSFSWSPDARKLVFGGPDGIDVIDSDGGGRKRLHQSGGWLAWSPDGTRIAFVGYRSDDQGSPQSDIFLMNPDGSGLLNMTQDPELEREVSWSPDGAKLLFDTYKHPNRVAVVNRDGSGRIDLTTDPAANYMEPDWSPDGREIVFVRYPVDDSASDVYVMQADGSGKRDISNTREREYGANW